MYSSIVNEIPSLRIWYANQNLKIHDSQTAGLGVEREGQKVYKICFEQFIVLIRKIKSKYYTGILFWGTPRHAVSAAGSYFGGGGSDGNRL